MIYVLGARSGHRKEMNALDWIAAAATFVLLGIPFYWFTLHPFGGFWRRHGSRPALIVATLVAWTTSGAILAYFSGWLFAAEQAPLWGRVAGLLLIAAEAAMLRQVFKTLGPDRVIGKVELGGAGQLHMTGLYGYVRHPSYAGMMGAMLGVCLLAGTMLMWGLAAVWFVLMRTMIFFEERELAVRFGDAYADYRRRVPALLPFRFWPAETKSGVH